jgi:ATP-dependent Clp protease ATP-binding subunit ClpC
MNEKRSFNSRITRAAAYAMYAASNRGIAIIDEQFFMFCLLAANKSYLSSFLGKTRVEKALQLSTEKYDEVKGEPCDSRVACEVGEALSFVSSNPQVGPIEILIYFYTNSEEAKKLLRSWCFYKKDLDAASKKRFEAEDLEDHSAFDKDFVDFVEDLTDKARRNELPLVFCRDEEIDKVIISLLRKLKNNPVLVGEPGVGKTAIVEGLAQKIVSGEVPEQLMGCRIYSLSLSAMMKDTKLRGQFEEKVHGMIEMLSADKKNILFIDEIHMIVGAGDTTSGPMDASNILKPYLARGDIRCIGATTYDDYRKYIRKDGALDRRFQKIDVHEPSYEDLVSIVNGLLPSFADHHECEVEEGVVEHILRLSDKYVATNFPDKAIDCLDESCARASLRKGVVDLSLVEEVIADASKIPITTIRKRDFEKVEDFSRELSKEIVGNEMAIKGFCRELKKHFKIGKGVFSAIFCGPEQIGKKSTAITLSKVLYGKKAIITLNGNDYSHPSDLYKLVGAPRYMGGGDEETAFVKTLRKIPYSIIFVKNCDSMHTSIRNAIEEMIREKRFFDNHGHKVDLEHTMFIFSVSKPPDKTLGFAKESGGVNYKDLPFSDLVNSVVVFQPLAEDQMPGVVHIELNQLLKTFGMALDYDNVVLETLINQGGAKTPGELRKKVRIQIEELLLDLDDSNKTLSVVDGDLVFR